MKTWLILLYLATSAISSLTEQLEQPRLLQIRIVIWRLGAFASAVQIAPLLTAAIGIRKKIPIGV